MEQRPKPRRMWPTALISVLATVVVITAAIAVAWRFDSFREMIGVRETPAATMPSREAPSLRRVLLSERDAAAARGDLVRVAMVHAQLSSEAQQRAAAVQRAWMGKRDPKTFLFPEAP